MKRTRKRGGESDNLGRIDVINVGKNIKNIEKNMKAKCDS
jgi:hypothetical protein